MRENTDQKKLRTWTLFTQCKPTVKATLVETSYANHEKTDLTNQKVTRHTRCLKLSVCLVFHFIVLFRSVMCQGLSAQSNRLMV